MVKIFFILLIFASFNLQAQTSNAGPDQNKWMPDNSVTLDGSGSTGATTYAWTKVAGPTEGNFSSTTTVNPTISNLAIGTYTFRLTINGGSANDVIVNVYPQRSDPCSVGAPVRYDLVKTGTAIFYTNIKTSFPLLKGGDTLAIPADTYVGSCLLDGVEGDSCRPVVIINRGGLADFTNGQFRLWNCRYFKLTGTGSPGLTYGLRFRDNNTSSVLPIRLSTNWTIEYCSFSGSVNAIFAKNQVTPTDALTYAPNWEFRECEIRNCKVDSTLGEAFYIGHTFSPDPCTITPNNLYPNKYKGISIHDNIIRKTGWDGIQTSNADSVLIYNNEVYEYGYTNRSSQQSGIILGGYCTGRVFNNHVYRGTGTGIAVFGYGGARVYDNNLDSCGTWPGFPIEGTYLAQPAMYLNGNVNSCLGAPSPKLQVNVTGNCIQHISAYANGAAIRNAGNNAIAGVIQNNIIGDPLSRSLANTIQSIPGDIQTGNTLGSCVGVNIPPVAGAGADKTITLPVNTTSFAGSESDADGTVASRLWTQISGAAAVITSPGSLNTTITGLSTAGVRVFRLTVTDNQGATGFDDVTVTVNAAIPVNVPPTANAGVNQSITLPTSSVTLSGTDADSDGTIVSRAWVKVSGGAGTITSPGSASTTVTGLVAGTYTFSYTVTDNDGATATDNVQIIVSAATGTQKIRIHYRLKTIS